MTDLLFGPAMAPFVWAISLVLLIMAIEIIGLLVGFSSMSEVDGDIDFDTDVDFDIDADIDMALGESAVSLNELDVALGEIDVATEQFNIWSWLEFGKVPVLVWLLSMAMGFAVSGFVIQMIAISILGVALFPLLASALAIPSTLFINKFICRGFSALVPKVSTQAINTKRLGGSNGVISVGTAEAGRPASARVKDRHGNTHTIRVVPYAGEAPLEQGTRIVVLSGDDPTVFNALSLDVAKERFANRS